LAKEPTFEEALDNELAHLGVVECPISRHDILYSHHVALEAAKREAREELADEVAQAWAYAWDCSAHPGHADFNDFLAQLSHPQQPKQEEE